MIKAPNYTQTPNVFFDEIMPTLKFGELKVLFVINRQTFGFHKEWDRISVSQLMKKTGMTKASVSKAVKSLINKNLIKKIKSGEKGEEKVFFHLVVFDEETEEIEKNSNNSDRYSKYPPPGIVSIPTKESTTKEIKENTLKENPLTPKGGENSSSSLKKEKYIPSQEAIELVDYCNAKAKQVNPLRLVDTADSLLKDRKAIDKHMLRVSPDRAKAFEIIKGVIDTLFNDPFWCDKITNIRYITRKWNDLSAKKPQKDKAVSSFTDKKQALIEANSAVCKKFMEEYKNNKKASFYLGKDYLEITDLKYDHHKMFDLKEYGLEDQIRSWLFKADIFPDRLFLPPNSPQVQRS